jgi:hypothetical protein
MEEKVRVEWVVRAIPLWLLQEYLQELGGRLTRPGRVEGPGWGASLEQAADFEIGSVRIGQVQLTLEADEEALRVIKPALEKKMLRAGG